MLDKIKNRIQHSLFMKLNNKVIYTIFLIISLIIIIFSHRVGELFIILKNIAYSIIAAVILAFFIDYNTLKRSEDEKIEFKKRYFETVNNYLSLIAGHLLWLDEHQDCESINWNLDSQHYLEIIGDINEKECPIYFKISFEEAIKKLEFMGDKYCIDNFSSLSNDDKIKVRKIFQMISAELKVLMNILYKINDDKLLLEINDYAHIGDISDFIANISLCCDNIDKQLYFQAILLLIESIKIIRRLGNYDNDIEGNMKEVIFLAKLRK